MPFTVKEFGENIRKLRLAAGLTHADVEAISRRYGYPVTQPTQSKAETALSKGLPSGAILIGLAYAYGETPSSLLDFNDEREVEKAPRRRVAKPVEVDPTVAKIEEVLRTLPAEFKEQALQYVQYLNKLAALQRQRNAFYFKEVVELVEHLDPKTQQNFAKIIQNMGASSPAENSGKSDTADPVAEPVADDLLAV